MISARLRIKRVKPTRLSDHTTQVTSMDKSREGSAKARKLDGQKFPKGIFYKGKIWFTKYIFFCEWKEKLVKKYEWSY